MQHLLDDFHTGALDATRRNPGLFQALKHLLDDFHTEIPKTPARGGNSSNIERGYGSGGLENAGKCGLWRVEKKNRQAHNGPGENASMRAHDWKIITTAAICTLWFAWLPDAPALGHGEEEILLFAYLAEEQNLLRISTAIVGGIILAMGAFITQQSRAEARARAGAEFSGFKVILPGLLVTCLGVAVLFTAAFILPEQIKIVHDHPLEHIETKDTKK